jgi:hypothetical protein
MEHQLTNRLDKKKGWYWVSQKVLKWAQHSAQLMVFPKAQLMGKQSGQTLVQQTAIQSGNRLEPKLGLWLVAYLDMQMDVYLDENWAKCWVQ